MRFDCPTIVDQLSYFSKHRLFVDHLLRFAVAASPLTQCLLLEEDFLKRQVTLLSQLRRAEIP